MARWIEYLAHGIDAPWNRQDFDLSSFAMKGTLTAVTLAGLFSGFLDDRNNNGFDKLNSLNNPRPPAYNLSRDNEIYLNPSLERDYQIDVSPFRDSGSVSGNTHALFGLPYLENNSSNLFDRSSLEDIGESISL